MANVNQQGPAAPPPPQIEVPLLANSVAQCRDAVAHWVESCKGVLTAFADELPKLQNLPAIGGNDAILQQLQQMERNMQRNMQQREERLTGRLDTIQEHQHELRQEVQQLRADTAVRAQAMNHNSIARLHNMSKTDPSDNLVALHDLGTNVAIPGFPNSDDELQRMARRNQMDPVLRALGLPTNGNMDAKRQRLRFHIGVRRRVE